MLKLILGRSGCGKTTTVLKRLCQAGQERRQEIGRASCRERV